MPLSIESFEFSASYPRRSYRSTTSDAIRLRCLGKKYTQSATPLVIVSSDTSSVIQPSAEDSGGRAKFNVVLAHANGFNKELYEPFIQYLFDISSDSIQAVFIHDVVTQGQSGRINATSIGDEYSWSDSSRDILAMVYELRKIGLMTYDPLIGIGHSMGGCQIAHAAMLHDRIFVSIILIDPVIAGHSGLVKATRVAQLSAKRRDTWPSKEEARKALLKSPFYRSWHPAVFEKWMEYGLTPTSHGKEVGLTTTAAQEVYSFLHFLPYMDTRTSNPDTGTFVYQHLKYLPLAVHLVFGETSATIDPELRQSLYNELQNGTRVDVPDCGHLVPMEKPEACAEICANYVQAAIKTSAAARVLDRSTQRDLKLSDEFKHRLDTMVSGTTAANTSKAKL